MLQVGNLTLAAKLLGRPYSITGRVQYGDQIGRTLDFPTINVRLNRHKPCLNGIYGVKVIETTSLTQKVLQDNHEKPGIAGYHENSLYGAESCQYTSSHSARTSRVEIRSTFP